MSVHETTPQSGGIAVSRKEFLGLAMLGAVGAARPRLTRGPMIAMMGGSSPKPYDAEVEYLESTGTQCIDTGIEPQNGRYVIDFDAQLVDVVASVFVIACGNISGSYRFWPMASNSSSAAFHYAYGYDYNVTGVTQPYGKARFVVREIFEDNNQYVYVNGKENTRSEKWKPSMGGRTLMMFCGKDNDGTLIGFSSSRIWYLKMNFDGVDILDMIPVRVGQVGYMYDRVSKRLFGNDGTGAFVIGPDK